MPEETHNHQPFFSIIVLNWNGEQYLPRCLDAIASQTFRDFEVILLDNASSDYSMKDIEAHWPEYRVLRFQENLGFARANNIGAEKARGKWLALLNNDAFPLPNWLAELASAVNENPQAAFFSSQLVYADRPERVQSSGDIYHISGFAWPRDNNIELEKAHQIADEVFSACGAAALYKREAYLEAGGFDEKFWSHLEDVDLGFRLRLNGYRGWYVPSAVVHHTGSASFGLESNRAVYQVQRNVVWVYFKNMPGQLFWKYLPAHLFTNFIFLVYYSLRGQAKSVWKAKWDAARGLPGVFHERDRIQKKRSVTPEEISRIIDHCWWAPFALGRRGRKIRDHLERSTRSKVVI